MTEALKIEHLNKRFKHFVLQDINLDVPKGMVVGLIGENGSGKSTTRAVFSIRMFWTVERSPFMIRTR